MAEVTSMAGGAPDRTTGPSGHDIQTLIVQHHRDVYRYAYRLTGNQPDAEDLTQQTFLVAQQRLHQLRAADRAIGWLFAIVRTCFLKGERKRQPVSAGSVGLEVEDIPDEIAETAIDPQVLQSAIDALPDEFKLVLVMFYFENCSYKEIAAQLNIPMGTVMSRLTRAKSRLRKQLLDLHVVDPEASPRVIEETRCDPLLVTGRPRSAGRRSAR
jgi:RNA polymerase sigma-70 factor (ECF subfamily)